MSANEMTCRERIEAAILGEPVDRTPILGGWISCRQSLCELAGVTDEELDADPVGVNVRAYRALGTDGLIGTMAPRKEDFRIVSKESYAHADTGMSLEQTFEAVDKLPDPAEVERQFDADFENQYAAFKAGQLDMGPRCAPMVWLPAQWGAGAQASWYGWFGYENFFLLAAMDPERLEKLFRYGGAVGYTRGRLIGRAVREGLYPHAVLLGEDICTQRGPMLSPAMIEELYIPHLAHGLAPLLEAGCRPVWHCDGDCRPLLPMLLNAGVQGLQGFQPECGMDIDSVVRLRTREGDPLVIFGPLSVTTELPVCSPGEIRDKVRHAIDVCRGNARLLLFTANTINPDVPVANIRAMCEAVR